MRYAFVMPWMAPPMSSPRPLAVSLPCMTSPPFEDIARNVAEIQHIAVLAKKLLMFSILESRARTADVRPSRGDRAGAVAR